MQGYLGEGQGETHHLLGLAGGVTEPGVSGQRGLGPIWSGPWAGLGGVWGRQGWGPGLGPGRERSRHRGCSGWPGEETHMMH